MRSHHAHIDLATEDRRVELHVGAALVGHGPQLFVDDGGEGGHLFLELVELIAAGNRDFVRSDDGRFFHAAGQFLFPAERFQIS